MRVSEQLHLSDLDVEHLITALELLADTYDDNAAKAGAFGLQETAHDETNAALASRTLATNIRSASEIHYAAP